MSMSAAPPWLFSATLGVAGVSYYQAAVKTVSINDTVVLAHSLTNKDPWAVGIYTEDKQLVGYLPKELAKKLTNTNFGGTPGGRWAGVVTETTQYENIKGLRIKVLKAYKTTSAYVKDITNVEENTEYVYSKDGSRMGKILKKTEQTVTIETEDGTHVWPVGLLYKNKNGHYTVSSTLA